MSRRIGLIVAASSALALVNWANAAALFNLTILGSTSGDEGTFASSLTAAPNSTIYWEVTGQFAAVGTTNANTARTPNGTTDSFTALPYFTLSTSSGAFATSVISSALAGTGSNNGSGSPSGPVYGTHLDNIRLFSTNSINADGEVILLSGTLTLGDAGATISGATSGSTGSLKVAGSPVAITATTEASGDPLLSYTGLVVAVPEPSSLAVVGFGGLLLLRRRGGQEEQQDRVS